MHEIGKKVVLIGKTKAGKTSIVNGLNGLPYNEDLSATVVAVRVSSFPVTKTFVWKIWDTAGAERFETLISNSLQKAEVVLLVIDGDKEKKEEVAIKEAKGFYDMIKEAKKQGILLQDVKIIAVITKSDGLSNEKKDGLKNKIMENRKDIYRCITVSSQEGNLQELCNFLQEEAESQMEAKKGLELARLQRMRLLIEKEYAATSLVAFFKHPRRHHVAAVKNILSGPYASCQELYNAINAGIPIRNTKGLLERTMHNIKADFCLDDMPCDIGKENQMVQKLPGVI